LRIGQAVESIEEGTADLVQSGVGELHLGLSTGRPRNAVITSAGFEVVEQGRLADPGLASHDEHLALPGAGARDQTVEGGTLAMPAEQHGLTAIRPVTHEASWGGDLDSNLYRAPSRNGTTGAVGTGT
jgi:hypothetical protein